MAAAQQPAVRGSAQSNAAVIRELRHELVMLPWYSVLDNLAYGVNGAGSLSQGRSFVRRIMPKMLRRPFIVKSGRVTLEGAVATQADKDVANVQANGVSGVFSVTDNVVVAGGK
ncbi:MAG TPA: BON domain-containing protein [Candidatus Acidoferrales bacterium]|nr:BON domain-containing protein [Candidatus Acidoferrales bacterium]